MTLNCLNTPDQMPVHHGNFWLFQACLDIIARALRPQVVKDQQANYRKMVR